jgi:outer membrane receptor protein involved in Fe transport
MGTAGNPYRMGLVRNVLYAALCVALFANVPAAHAQSTASSESIRQYDIPAGSLSSALGAWGAQSDKQVVFAPDLVAGKRTRGLSGQYAAEQALTQLLAGTGLAWKRVNGQTYALEKAPPPQPASANHKPAPKSKTSPSAAAQKPTQLDAVSVTGTRIRGGVTASPTITIGAQQIQDEGFTDLGEVIRSIPQNFNGGQNPGVTTGAGAGGFYNQNITGGSTANLRGIGQDATLTLLNGRRMSYGGYDQAVDISAIPVEAVDRIEIVTDGASAIYGSDAVGGVINVKLKRDFNGVAVGTRYGKATEGGLATHEYNATAGTTWSTGGLIATWKKESNDPIYADQRDYTRAMYGPSTLYQGADLRSGLLSMHQSLGDFIELHLDALRTERGVQKEVGYSTAYYHYPTETTTFLVSPSVAFSLPHDWTINVSVAAGRDKTEFRALGLMRATGEIYLNRSFSYGNRSRMYEVDGEGPLFSLPAGDARLAVGAGYRHNDFLYLYIGSPTADGKEGSRFAYAELNLPLVSPDQSVAGIHRLELTGAIRTEDYDSYGRVTTPKIGVIYSPSADWTLKGSWGKSFKEPTLFQGYIEQFSYLYPATTFGGTGYAPDATALYLNGGNLALTPERAKTWSTSIAFHPEALPRLETELTAFHIDYTDRIVQPITSTSDVLANPAYAEFVTHDPTAEEKAEVLASTEFTNYTGSPYDPGKLVAIIDNRFVNASRQRIKGIDLSGSYRFDLAKSGLTLRGSVSWLDSERALTPTSVFSDSAGILFYPVKVNGRVGAVWARDRLTASIFGNYKSGVTNPGDGTKGASFTTLDLTLRYDTGARDGIFSNMAFEASAQNLFNRKPPLYVVTSFENAPYDSTNYSAIGRFLSFSISKRW